MPGLRLFRSLRLLAFALVLGAPPSASQGLPGFEVDAGFVARQWTV